MLAGAVMIMADSARSLLYSDGSDPRTTYPLALFMPRFVGWRLRHPTMY